MLYQLVKAMTAGALRVFFRFRVVGAEHVPREGAALLAANLLFEFVSLLALP